MSFEIISNLPACGRCSPLGRASVFVEFREPAVAGQHALSWHFIKICEQMVSECMLPDLLGGFPVYLDFVGDHHHGTGSATAGNHDGKKSTLAP
jgi:hypothetical protein